MGISNFNKTAILLGRIADVNSPTTPIVPHKEEKPLLNTISPDTYFPRCAPEDVGISSILVCDFLNKLKENTSLNMHSIIMSRNGKIFCEATFGTHRLNLHKATFSMCKSIVSLAVGIAIDNGLISNDTRIIDIFPELTNPIIRIKFSTLTVWHLLTMQSGIRFNEAECVTDDNWLRAFLHSGADDIGKKFNYNSLNTYVLVSIIERVSKTDFKTFIDEKLFGPLGIKNYHWEKCSKGVIKGGWGLFLSPYDILKLGMLTLEGGKWDGNRIVSEQYVAAATSYKVKVPESYGAFDYGYHIWVGKEKNVFLFNGMFGQNCLCFKDNGIIIVSNAGCDELFQSSDYYQMTLEYFSGSFTNPPKKRSNKPFIKTINSLKYKTSFFKRLINTDRKKLKKLCGAQYISDSPNCTGLLPTVLQVLHNNYSSGLKGISFGADKDGFYMTYDEANESHKIKLVPNGIGESILNFDGDSYIVSCVFRFAKNEYLQDVILIELNFIETPCTKHLKITFEDKENITLYQKEKPGKESVNFLMETIMEQLSAKPIISALINKLGKDYIIYQTDKIFTQKQKLKKTKTPTQ